jgi:tripartite-type tricarboxylate transporter receptor subunit TctC
MRAASEVINWSRHHETSTPALSASGSGRCRLPGPFTRRLGSELSDQPLRLILGYPPGGSADITARLTGQWLSERLGQPVIIESRPGAATNLATEAVVRAAPDGYTLLLIAPANAINATLYDKLNFNFLRDIEPIAGIIRFPNVVVVNPSLPIKSIPELIAYAKANPGKLNMASSGNGSTIHMSGELFKMLTGINMVHVPYRGGAPALTDLIAGQVHVMFDNIPTSAEHIKSGKLRGLAVTSAARSAVLPELPTVADFLLYPRKRTCAVQIAMSAMGQKRTSVPQSTRCKSRPLRTAGRAGPVVIDPNRM